MPQTSQKKIVGGRKTPVKFASPFRKKRNTKSSSNVKEDKLKRGPLLASLKEPLHSSTPKNLQRSSSLPTLVHRNDSDNFMAAKFANNICRDVRIVLTRVDDKLSSNEGCRDSCKKPEPTQKTRERQQKKSQVKKTGQSTSSKKGSTKASRQSKKQDQGTSDEKQNPRNSETSATTQIPSDALDFLGVSSMQRDEDQILQDPSVVPETPPQTSPTNSSTKGSTRGYLRSINLYHSTTLDFSDCLTEPSNAVIPVIGHFPNHPSSTRVSEMDDPLDYVNALEPPIHGNRIHATPVRTHCEILFGVNERLYSAPESFTLEQLNYGNGSIRATAPYALKLKNDRYFQYACAICRVGQKYCCLVFGVSDGYLIAYGGRFHVDQDRIFDPRSKAPVVEVALASAAVYRQHLGVFFIPNKTLLATDGYLPKACGGLHAEIQVSATESFMNSISQIQLKEKTRCEAAIQSNEAELRALRALKCVEPSAKSVQNVRLLSALKQPRVEQVFSETNLPITDKSRERISKSACAVGVVKTRHGERATFQQKCVVGTDFDTVHYAAHEGLGCMSFYSTAFVLGRLDDHFVVGVVEGDCFFIMATTRLYNRFSDHVQLVPFTEELLEMIVVPLRVPYEHCLTMLETRQILAHPHKHQLEMRLLSTSLGIHAFVPSLTAWTLVLSHSDEQENIRTRNTWMQKVMIDNFSSKFRSSLCEFPESVCSANNQQLFAENMTKLWIHQLVRGLHFRKEIRPSASQPTMMSPFEFFSLDVESFCAMFAGSFALSSECVFRCVQIGPDGLPTGLCCESLTVKELGQHVHRCHTAPLIRDDPHKQLRFVPFSLVFEKHGPLEHGDSSAEALTWARATVESYRCKSSYMGVLQAAEKLALLDAQTRSSTPRPKRPDSAGAKLSPAASQNKRKRTPEEQVLQVELKRRNLEVSSSD